MPQTFTLDTNCLIDVADNRPAAEAVRTLADAHAAGRADVAVVAMSASEKQQGRHYIRNFAEFRDRLVSLGLGHLNVILPMGYWDISFWGQCLWADEAMVKREHEIHSILFPAVQFLPPPNPPTDTWRNRKCDVQAIWSHIHHKRDVFVTSDSNFHKADKKAALIDLGANRIEHTEGALSLFPNLINLEFRGRAKPRRCAPRMAAARPAKPKTKGEPEMRRTFIMIAAVMVLGPASAYAKDNSDLALALGTVLGSEEFCGLDYDQAAIQAFITKRVSADDMDFPSLLESMTTGTEVGNQTKSNSAKTAHCTQIARIAKSYGFTH